MNQNKEFFYKQLYMRYAPMLMRFAEKFVPRSYVEDIVHDVFLKIWDKNIPATENELRNILFVSVRNACIDHLRRIGTQQKYRNKKAVELQFEELLYLKNPNDIISDEIVLGKIMEKIDRLPPKRREIFRLAYLEGMKASDIAVHLDISVRTVENNLYRAITYLRDSVS